MRVVNKTIPGYKILAVLIFVLAYILSMAHLNSFGNDDVIDSNVIVAYSWVGIVVFLAYIFWWKKLTGKILTPFVIFLLFVTLFNFGQCFLWAFGIHSDSEIGRKLVFSSVAANNALIIKAQIMYIISYVAINTGALVLYRKDKKKTVTLLKDDKSNSVEYKALFIASIISSLLSVPITLYVAINKTIYTQMYSYHEMYYGPMANMFDGPLFAIGCGLFFISLIGLLIGSKYNKNVMYLVYIIFALYAGISLLGGDRGEWVMPFLFLFWMHISLYKPVRKKTVLLLGVVAFFSLYVINAIVSLRNTGLSYDGFVDALTIDGGVVRPLLIEFGQTMGISIILLAKNTVSLYGNTYLMSIPTILGTGIANKLFGMEYVQLHTWFPLEYLGINYGTDFSIIGEAILNCGTATTPIVMLIGGLIIGKIFNYPFNRKIHPFILCVALSAMISIIGISRSTLWITLNKIVLPIVVFALIYIIAKTLVRNKASQDVGVNEGNKDGNYE